MRWNQAVVAGLVVTALTGGCQDTSDDGFRLDATGTVNGLAWLDRNGNGVLDGSDGPARDVRVDLLHRFGATSLYGTSTDAAGEFVLPNVRVGDYRAVVDSGSVGDSLRILRVDSAALTVMAGDTSTVLIGVTYPNVSTDGARTTALDRRIFIEGRVISERSCIGDAAVHVRDTTGALRAVRAVPNSAAAGDSVRLLGVTTQQSGQRVLKDAAVFLLETGIESPDPLVVTTAAARSAADGRLDAELVRVEDAVVEDTTRNAFGEPVLEVNDGSGPADIVLDRDIPFFLTVPGGGELIGSRVNATGILVPSTDGIAASWVMKPRSNADIVVNAP